LHQAAETATKSTLALKPNYSVYKCRRNSSCSHSGIAVSTLCCAFTNLNFEMVKPP